MHFQLNAQVFIGNADDCNNTLHKVIGYAYNLFFIYF